MDLFQAIAADTAVYPNKGNLELCYPALGLAEEAGEVLGQIKRIVRDDACRLTPERKAKLVAEMGDVLWYLAALSTELGVKLSDVAYQNTLKVERRSKAGSLKGEGSDR